jgi:hypothetical protein
MLPSEGSQETNLLRTKFASSATGEGGFICSMLLKLLLSFLQTNVKPLLLFRSPSLQSLAVIS